MASVTKKKINSWWKLICNYIELKLIIITLLYMYNGFPPKSPLIPSKMPINFAANLQSLLWEMDKIAAAPCYLSFTAQKWNNSSPCGETMLFKIIQFNQRQFITGFHSRVSCFDTDRT